MTHHPDSFEGLPDPFEIVKHRCYIYEAVESKVLEHAMRELLVEQLGLIGLILPCKIILPLN